MPLGIALVFAMLLAYLISHCPMLQVTAQPGFVSIDCGGSSGTYTDPETRLTWISDSNGFGLETVSRSATVSFPAQYPWLSSMRFFEGTQSKYCYEFGESNGIEQSNPYLVRASFWIGDKPPFSTPNKEHIRFLLLINADEWDSIDISLPQKEPLVMEMVVVAVVPVLSVCVVGRGETAFISSLELRPLSKNLSSVKSFMQTPLQENAAPRAMFRYARLDFGSTKDVRYPDDVYDRIWSENTQDYIHSFAPHPQATTNTFYSIHGGEETPSVVLQTAVVDNSSFNVTFHGFTRNYDFSYIIFYAEIADNVTKDERFFNQETITGSGVMSHISNIAMATGESIAYYNQVLLEVEEDGFLTFSFERNSTSSLGPLVNALELLYSSKDPLSLKTYNDDVTTLESIKEKFGGFDSWRGDPCLPYSYEWLTCNSEIRPHIIKLSLQNRDITAEIPAEIGNLKDLVELNLQGNNLTGSIPESIAHLPNLLTLFLQDNNLSGTIPQALLDKKVDLRLSGNPIVCKDNNAVYCGQQSPPLHTESNEKSKEKYTLIVVILSLICVVVNCIYP